MAKWFVEYSIVESTSEGWTERDGDKFFTLPVDRLSANSVEAIFITIAKEEGVEVDDIVIDNIAKINTN